MFSEELTPIEEWNGILLKREDKYISGLVNGGKLRQADYLIKNNLDKIKKGNNSVVCSVSLKSPQSAIISEVCKKYGIICNILCYKTLNPNRNLSIAQENGAFIYGFKVGHSNVLEAYAKKYFPDDFYINMGFADEDVINANINQVENIPRDLDYLIVPIGSAMNFISIIRGLEKFKINPKNVVGIYVGRSPVFNLNKYLSLNQLKDINIIKSPYKYSEEINVCNYYLDPIYEAKAYDYIEVVLNKPLKTLLWVVGKRNLDFPFKKIDYKEVVKDDKGKRR